MCTWRIIPSFKQTREHTNTHNFSHTEWHLERDLKLSLEPDLKPLARMRASALPMVGSASNAWLRYRESKRVSARGESELKIERDGARERVRGRHADGESVCVNVFMCECVDVFRCLCWYALEFRVAYKFSIAPGNIALEHPAPNPSTMPYTSYVIRTIHPVRSMKLILVYHRPRPSTPLLILSISLSLSFSAHTVMPNDMKEWGLYHCGEWAHRADKQVSNGWGGSMRTKTKTQM
jgi:hypothetical protein